MWRLPFLVSTTFVCAHTRPWTALANCNAGVNLCMCLHLDALALLGVQCPCTEPHA
jgi:hypothetical protein